MAVLFAEPPNGDINDPHERIASIVNALDQARRIHVERQPDDVVALQGGKSERAGGLVWRWILYAERMARHALFEMNRQTEREVEVGVWNGRHYTRVRPSR